MLQPSSREIRWRMRAARALAGTLPQMPGLTRLLRAVLPPGRFQHAFATPFDGGVWEGNLHNLLD